MYARWHSARQTRRCAGLPALCHFLEEALTIARFELGMYEVVRFAPVGDGSFQ